MNKSNDLMIQEELNTLIEVVKTLNNGECAIALAGAHAKGVADSASDIDLFLFTDTLKSFEERKHIIQTIADENGSMWISQDKEENPWGKSIDFSFKGIPVEVTVRTFSQMEKNITHAFEGKFDIIPATWTSNGYYSFIYLCELSFIKTIWDPTGKLKGYQGLVSVYPKKLKASIIKCFMQRANTWLNNFHYESAIKRVDILFTAPIVLHTVLDMIQVIFALNEVYFTGDKKLENALGKMKYCPPQLLDNLDFLLSSPRDVGLQQKQHHILSTIYQDLSAMILK